MPTRIDPELGIIDFVRSARAKNINVCILQNNLRVNLPAHTSEEEALRFIDSVRAKIIQKQNKIKLNALQNNLLLDENSHLQTLTFIVQVQAAERKDVFVSLRDGVLNIEYPAGKDCTTELMQSRFWTGVNYFLKKEAKKNLPIRARRLADEYGFSFDTVKIQASKSRWGSCSRGKNINLSYFLMLLPQHLVDYVILHELCHTKEMNHSLKFWQWMDRVTNGRSKTLRVELKKYHIPQHFKL